MNLDQLSGVGFGTVLLVVVFAGLFIFKKALRERLFPGPVEKDREAAMTELLLFQAQLEERVNKDTGRAGDGEEIQEGRADDAGAVS